MSRFHSVLLQARQRSTAVQIALFARELWRAKRIRPETRAREMLVHFPEWRRSLRRDSIFLPDQPWVTYDARAFFDSILTKDMRVFEFGAGSSTLYFARRVREGFSVDHNPEWVERVRRALADARLGNWHVDFVAPVLGTEGRDPSDPSHYASVDPDWAAHSFRDYAQSIERHPDSSFDFVLVDGRARAACSRHALAKVKPGGWFVLDNAERPEYEWVHATLRQRAWECATFYGPGPSVSNFWKTTLWRRPLQSEGEATHSARSGGRR